MDKNALEYIKQQSEQFSLEDFYLNNDVVIKKNGLMMINPDGVDGAMIVITPFQTISLPAPEEHGEVAKRIYRVLYDDFKDFTFPRMWYKQALEYGNVLIQVCLGSYSPVWIPEHINDYQYSMLEQLVSFIKEYRLTEKELYYKTNIDDKNLEDVMEELKSRVTDIPYQNQEHLLWEKKKQK